MRPSGKVSPGLIVLLVCAPVAGLVDVRVPVWGESLWKETVPASIRILPFAGLNGGGGGGAAVLKDQS
jgi:hypothetical protein